LILHVAIKKEKETKREKTVHTQMKKKTGWLPRIHANISYYVLSLIVFLRFGNRCLANRARVLPRKPLFDAIHMISMTAF
jgi:hypothetical protein